MSVTPLPVMAARHDEAGRWTAWEREYSDSSLRTAFQARVVFALLLTGAGAWLGLQLMTMPV